MVTQAVMEVGSNAAVSAYRGGDAWCAIEALKRVVKEGDVFDSVGEAYAFAVMKLAGLVEKRWE